MLFEFQTRSLDYWIRRRLQYGRLRDLVVAVNQNMAECILLSFANDLFFLCKQIFLAIRWHKLFFLSHFDIALNTHNFASFISLSFSHRIGHFQRLFVRSLFYFRSLSKYCVLLLFHFQQPISMTNRRRR